MTWQRDNRQAIKARMDIIQIYIIIFYNIFIISARTYCVPWMGINKCSRTCDRSSVKASAYLTSRDTVPLPSINNTTSFVVGFIFTANYSESV